MKPKHPNAQKTHCIRGHRFDEKNTRIYQGRRYCRECDRLRSKANYDRWYRR